MQRKNEELESYRELQKVRSSCCTFTVELITRKWKGKNWILTISLQRN